MYKVDVEVRESRIDGKGVFAKRAIRKGAIVWQYVDGHDKKLSVKDFEALNHDKKKELERVAYLSPTTGFWVIPPANDPACYTNHDPRHFNTTVVVDKAISDEPLFVADRDIGSGEEITNNYLEFDNNTKPGSQPWLE